MGGTMKKTVLSCMAVLAALSLTACGSAHAHKAQSKSASSSKVVKKHKSKDKKKESKAEESSSQSGQAKNTTKTSNAGNQGGTQEADQADPFNAGTWDKPYKGYPNFNAYMRDHPDTPNIQSQTAQIQHAQNVKRGIENPDGTMTQNFQNWMSVQDQQEQQGIRTPEYDQNVNWGSTPNQ